MTILVAQQRDDLIRPCGLGAVLFAKGQIQSGCIVMKERILKEAKARFNGPSLSWRRMTRPRIQHKVAHSRLHHASVDLLLVCRASQRTDVSELSYKRTRGT